MRISHRIYYGVMFSLLGFSVMSILGSSEPKEDSTAEVVTTTQRGQAVDPGQVGRYVVVEQTREPSRETTVQASSPIARAPGAAAPPSRESIDEAASYQRAVGSVFLIVAVREVEKQEQFGFGTGVLIDAERRLILTAAHVVAGVDAVVVFAPDRDGSNAIHTQPKHYLDHAKELGVACGVIGRETKCDLALLRMASPPRAPAMRISARGCTPGQPLFTIGSSGVSRDGKLTGPLWRFAGGHVRQVCELSLKLENTQELNAKLLETTVPVNKGDSGGPLVDRAGELVGINSFMFPQSNLVQYAIDSAEIRAFLSRLGADRMPVAADEPLSKQP